jgi:hypothetical protein
MKRLSVFALVLLVSGCTAPRQAAVPTAPAAQQSSARAAQSGMRSIADVTRDATMRDGFFTTYEKGEQLFLAVPAGRLNDDFLLTFKVAQGIGSNGIFGGTMLNIFEGAIVAFEMHGDRILLVQKPHRFTAEEGSPAERAVQISFGSSVLEQAKVEAMTVAEGDTTYLINIYDWMLSDLSNIGLRIRGAASGNVTFDKSRSHLESVKGFPQNVNVRAKLTFRPQQPASIQSVPDSRFVPVSIFYTMAQLPEVPMEPRLADDRVGYFMTVRKNFSDDNGDFFQRYVNRWRLEPGESAGNGLVYPVRPITYYIDHTVPEEYRPFMKEGVLAWNAAFEQAGFKDAIQVAMLPDDADAEDIRFPTLRWNTSDRPGYGAIGPSIVDPRTGEILDSDQLYEANMVRGWKNAWRTQVSPSMAIDEIFAATNEDIELAAMGVKGDMWAAEISAQGSMLRALLAARGEIAAGDEVPMEYIGEAMRWVTMHEVGHTLGLRHNFRASADTPLDKLHDRQWARERGIYNSVMEYPSVNIAPPGQQNGYFYNPGVGSYDKWAISFGYTPDAARASEIARKVAMPGHAYGTDEDARGPASLDPQVNTYQLSGEPLAWGKQRANIVRDLWVDLPNHVLSDNARYADLTDAMNTLLFQYARALAVAPKYIGGQYVHRDRVGDPQGRAPFVPVSRAEQQEALDFLSEYAFSEQAFALPQQTLTQMGANRWSHWGESNTINGRIDYPIHEQVLGIQRSILNQLMHPLVFSRIRDAEVRWGAGAVLPIPDLMQTLTHTIWSEVWDSRRNVNSMRRDLQRLHIDQLTEIVTTNQNRMPADGRALARYQLNQLDGRLQRSLQGGGRTLDAYTRAHLLESRERISRALQAGLEVERR